MSRLKRLGQMQTGTVIRAVLWSQIAVGLFLVLADIGPALPSLLSPSRAPAMDMPVRPGDQTRRYDPAAWPDGPSAPTRPYDMPANLPSRLIFDVADIGGAPVLTMIGAIRAGDAKRFSDWLGEQGDDLPVRVTLNSPGGSVSDALAIGKRLRADKRETQVLAGDICMSACPYVLAAGVARRVDHEAAVGVHQHYHGENTLLPAFVAVEQIQAGQGRVLEYLDEMGIDPMLMRHSLATPPKEIYVLLPEELETYRLATEILADGKSPRE